MKKIVIIITLITLLAGCVSKPINGDQKEYSFDDPDVIAYINGESANRTSMLNYITMKKAYIEELSCYVGYVSDDLPLPERILSKWYNEQTKEILLYSDEDWENEYYKSIILSQRYHEIVKDADVILNKEADEQLQNIATVNIDEGATSGSTTQKNDIDAYIIIQDGNIVTIGDGINVGAVDLSLFDVRPVIESVTNDLNISYYDCLYSVYRPFWISDYIYNYLLNIRFDDLDYGDIVEYNGTNDFEYEVYLLNVMEINNIYFDSLLDQAEIIERP